MEYYLTKYTTYTTKILSFTSNCVNIYTYFLQPNEFKSENSHFTLPSILALCSRQKPDPHDRAQHSHRTEMRTLCQRFSHNTTICWHLFALSRSFDTLTLYSINSQLMSIWLSHCLALSRSNRSQISHQIAPLIFYVIFFFRFFFPYTKAAVM